MSNTIPLSQPDITDADVRTVIAALRSGRLSMGPYVEEFEALVSRRLRRTHGIAVNRCPVEWNRKPPLSWSVMS